ncbi:hypothetical protein V9T40_005948 [Parthenolecanium corni]|uniref:FGFR1 oncogene partner 2 homolog n=1 Tax=Parthenolecanium corni TaxID=536013 RepID=A0AAN9TTS8_9HEMI
MSLTIQQILMDAKKLSDKLKEHDTAADALLSQTQSVYKQIDAMKHYADDLAELNESAKHGQNGKIIAGLQHESRQLRELQIENEELKSAVQDYHNAVELIMSKYRSHTGQLLSSSRLDLSLLNNEHQNKIIEAQTEKINEMAAVMMEAANCVEKEETHLEEIITRLKIENQGLRELLAISKQFGSIDAVKETASEPEQTAS